MKVATFTFCPIDSTTSCWYRTILFVAYIVKRRGRRGHRRAEATPSFGRLCPAMTMIEKMLIHLNTLADLEEAIHALLKQDPRLRPIFELPGIPALRQRQARSATRP